jgi:hypothetical protein
MRNLGMLPSTRYKLLGLWLVTFIVGCIYFMQTIGDAWSGAAWVWFFLTAIAFGVVGRIWAGARQMQVNLEWEHRLKSK